MNAVWDYFDNNLGNRKVICISEYMYIYKRFMRHKYSISNQWIFIFISYAIQQNQLNLHLWLYEHFKVRFINNRYSPNGKYHNIFIELLMANLRQNVLIEICVHTYMYLNELVEQLRTYLQLFKWWLWCSIGRMKNLHIKE